MRCQQGQTALDVAHQRGHGQCALLLQHAQYGGRSESAAGAAGTSQPPYRQQQRPDSLQERSAVGQPSAGSEGFSRPSLSPLDLGQQEASSARTMKPTQVRALPAHPPACGTLQAPLYCRGFASAEPRRHLMLWSPWRQGCTPGPAAGSSALPASPSSESEPLLQALEQVAGSHSASQSQQAGPPADRGDEEEAVRQQMAFALRSHPTDSFPGSSPLTCVWGSNGGGDSQPSAFLLAAGEAFSPKPLGLTIPHGVLSGAMVAQSVQALQGQAGSSAALRLLPDLDSWGSFSSKRTSLESPSCRLHSIEGHPAVFVNAGVPQVQPCRRSPMGCCMDGACLISCPRSQMPPMSTLLPRDSCLRGQLALPPGMDVIQPIWHSGTQQTSQPAGCRNHGG